MQYSVLTQETTILTANKGSKYQFDFEITLKSRDPKMFASAADEYSVAAKNDGRSDDILIGFAPIFFKDKIKSFQNIKGVPDDVGHDELYDTIMSNLDAISGIMSAYRKWINEPYERFQVK